MLSFSQINEIRKLVWGDKATKKVIGTIKGEKKIS